MTAVVGFLNHQDTILVNSNLKMNHMNEQNNLQLKDGDG